MNSLKEEHDERQSTSILYAAQALKTLQSDPGQTQMPGGQESTAQASFQSSRKIF